MRGPHSFVPVLPLLSLLLVLSSCGGEDLHPTGAAPPPDRRHLDFGSDAVGETPRGYEVVAGAWTVGEAEGDRFLAQEAANDDAVFNVLLLNGDERSDVDLSVRVRAESGEIDQGGGLVWRALDGRNYYIARWNPLEDNVRLYKVVDGVRTQIASADLATDPAAWHELRVVMERDHVVVSFDGQALLDARDPTFAAAGRVGLWTKADAKSRFDDLRVAAPTPPPRTGR